MLAAVGLQRPTQWSQGPRASGPGRRTPRTAQLQSVFRLYLTRRAVSATYSLATCGDARVRVRHLIATREATECSTRVDRYHINECITVIRHNPPGARNERVESGLLAFLIAFCLLPCICADQPRISVISVLRQAKKYAILFKRPAAPWLF